MIKVLPGNPLRVNECAAMPSVNNVIRSTWQLIKPRISKFFCHFVCRIICFLKDFFLLVTSVQSCVSQVSIKNNSTKFLTLSQLFANSDFIILTSHFFFSITLSMEVTINITLSQSLIIIKCFNHVAHKHFSKKVKGVLTVKVL